MQAHVNEIAGHVFHERPLARGVGDNQCDVMTPEQLDEIAVEKGGMANFQSVTHWAIMVCACPRASVEAGVVLAGEFRRSTSVAWQQMEKIFQARRVVAEAWRQLPQERAELFAKEQDPRGEEIG